MNLIQYNLYGRSQRLLVTVSISSPHALDFADFIATRSAVAASLYFACICCISDCGIVDFLLHIR